MQKDRTSDLIVRYYAGQMPDDRGRYLADVQNWPDEELEAVHDFVQWMFPLRERSAVNPMAPMLDEDSIKEFRARTDLQQNLRVSWERMLLFYGLKAGEGEEAAVTRGPNFAARSRNWLRPGNHNHLRITRILKCLNALGLRPEALAFFDCLTSIYEESEGKSRITPETVHFWQEAVR